MDATTAADMENVKAPHQHHDDLETQIRQTAAKHRAASMLSFLSLVLLAESVYRIVGVVATPEGGWGLSSGVFPPAALITGGVFEFLFAGLGLFVGLGWNMFELGHKGLTMVLLGTQALLGLYVYVVFAIALPAFYIDRQEYDTSNAKAATVFGWLFTAMGYDGLLQAGAFLAALQLFQLQSGKQLSSRFFKPFLLTLASLVFLVGFSTFLCGVLVRVILYNDLYYTDLVEEFGSVQGATQAAMRGLLFGVFNAIRYTPITIISGLTIMMYAPLLASGRLAPAAAMFGIYVWLWMLCCHVLTQYGSIPAGASMLLGPGLIGAEALLTGLFSTVLVVVPLFFGAEAFKADAE